MPCWLKASLVAIGIILAFVIISAIVGHFIPAIPVDAKPTTIKL